ncbi:hypothetical protein [Spirosoma aerophilum]
MNQPHRQAFRVVDTTDCASQPEVITGNWLAQHVQVNVVFVISIRH